MPDILTIVDAPATTGDVLLTARIDTESETTDPGGESDAALGEVEPQANEIDALAEIPPHAPLLF